MVRTRKLKKVSFMSRGKKVYFFAKRQAASAYRASKPYAKRGAAAAYRGGKKAARYGRAQMKAYIAQSKASKGRSRPKAQSAKRHASPRQTVRVGHIVRTRQGVGTVVAIRQSKSMGGTIAVVKYPGRRGEFSRIVHRTSDVKRVQ